MGFVFAVVYFRYVMWSWQRGLGPVHLVHLAHFALVLQSVLLWFWRHLLTDQSSVLREALNLCAARAGRSACRRRQQDVHVLDAFTPRQSRVPQPDTPGGKCPASVRFTSRRHLRDELTENLATWQDAWDEPFTALDGRCRFTRAGQRSTAALAN